MEWQLASRRGPSIESGWSRIDKETDLPADFEGKYLLLVPKNAITMQATAALDRNLHWTVTGRYLEHNDGPEDFVKYFILDSRISWQGDSGWLVVWPVPIYPTVAMKKCPAFRCLAPSLRQPWAAIFNRPR